VELDENIDFVHRYLDNTFSIEVVAVEAQAIAPRGAIVVEEAQVQEVPLKAAAVEFEDVEFVYAMERVVAAADVATTPREEGRVEPSPSRALVSVSEAPLRVNLPIP